MTARRAVTKNRVGGGAPVLDVSSQAQYYVCGRLLYHISVPGVNTKIMVLIFASPGGIL